VLPGPMRVVRGTVPRLSAPDCRPVALCSEGTVPTLCAPLCSEGTVPRSAHSAVPTLPSPLCHSGPRPANTHERRCPPFRRCPKGRAHAGRALRNLRYEDRWLRSSPFLFRTEASHPARPRISATGSLVFRHVQGTASLGRPREIDVREPLFRTWRMEMVGPARRVGARGMRRERRETDPPDAHAFPGSPRQTLPVRRFPGQTARGPAYFVESVRPATITLPLFSCLS
jgi:hypothetical protein